VLLGHRRQVVGMELIAPVGMLAVLGGEHFGQLGAQSRMLALIGANLALENVPPALLERAAL